MIGRLVAAGALFVLAACASDDASTPASQPSSSVPPIAIDWAKLNALDPIAVDRFRFVDCDGDAPLLCVEENGAAAGFVELKLLDRKHFGDPARSLDAIAGDLERSFRTDRTDGCPLGFRFRINQRTKLAVAGSDGLRTDWSVLDREGKEVERTLTYFALEPERVVVFTANSLDDGGCLEREGAEFRTATLGRVAPLLDRVVAGAKLPTGTFD